jgi:hypothetical protein
MAERDYKVWPIAKTADGAPIKPGMRVWISEDACGELDASPPRYQTVKLDKGPLYPAEVMVPWFTVRVDGQPETKELTGASLFAERPGAGSTPPPSAGDGQTGHRRVDPFSVRCPEGHTNPVGQNFCGQCAAPIQGLCANGHQNPPGQSFCGQCPAPLVGVAELHAASKAAKTPLAETVRNTVESQTVAIPVSDVVLHACNDIRDSMMKIGPNEVIVPFAVVRSARAVRILRPVRGAGIDQFARVLAAYLAATRALEVALSISFGGPTVDDSGGPSSQRGEVIAILHVVLLEDERVLLAEVIRRNGQPPVTTDWQVSGLDSRELAGPVGEAILSGLWMARCLERPDLRPLPEFLDETWDRDGMEFAVAMMFDMWPRIVEELNAQ